MARHLDLSWQGRSDHFALYESSGDFAADCQRYNVRFAASDWFGHQGADEALAGLARGDLKLVGASEKLLAELEEHLPHTQRYVNAMDVVGALPNVPAFLSGEVVR